MNKQKSWFKKILLTLMSIGVLCVIWLIFMDFYFKPNKKTDISVLKKYIVSKNYAEYLDLGSEEITPNAQCSLPEAIDCTKVAYYIKTDSCGKFESSIHKSEEDRAADSSYDLPAEFDKFKNKIISADFFEYTSDNSCQVEFSVAARSLIRF